MAVRSPLPKDFVLTFEYDRAVYEQVSKMLAEPPETEQERLRRLALQEAAFQRMRQRRLRGFPA